MKIHYFMSGIVYRAGTDIPVRHFSGFITCNRRDPLKAHAEMQRFEAERAAEKHSGPTYVHIHQFNEVRSK